MDDNKSLKNWKKNTNIKNSKNLSFFYKFWIYFNFILKLLVNGGKKKYYEKN